MPLQPKISLENRWQRFWDRAKEIPQSDNTDGSFNLDGYRYKPGDFDKYTSWWTFVFDAEKEAKELFFYPYIDKRSFFLDIGALCGSWTLPALKRGATVTSFEPDPNFYKILEGNIKLNDFKRWRGYNNGVYDHQFIGDVYDMQNVKFVTLDSLIDNNFLHSPFTYVKIDVEGAEIEVLRGGRNLLRMDRPIMWIECHEEGINGESVTPAMVTKELMDIFNDTYKIEKKTPVLTTPHIFARPI